MGTCVCGYEAGSDDYTVQDMGLELLFEVFLGEEKRRVEESRQDEVM